jgi:hypothetical protein
LPADLAGSSARAVPAVKINRTHTPVADVSRAPAFERLLTRKLPDDVRQLYSQFLPLSRAVRRHWREWRPRVYAGRVVTH